MNLIRKHKWVMTVLMVIVVVAMIATTILPYMLPQ